MLATCVNTLYQGPIILERLKYKKGHSYRNPDRLKPHIEYLGVLHQIVGFSTKWSHMKNFLRGNATTSSIKHGNEEESEKIK